MKHFKIITVLLLWCSANIVSAETAQTSLLKMKPYVARLEIGGQLRIRGEARYNYDLDSGKADANKFALLRTRLHFRAGLKNDMTAFIQLQDARSFGSEASTASNDMNVDLHQGYLEIRKLFDTNWEVRAGRQELSYGDERLIGAFGWSNIGRSFDGGRFRYRGDGWWFDIFAATVDENNTTGGVDEDENFFGAYWSYGPKTRQWQLYVLHKRDGDDVVSEAGDNTGPQRVTTIGGRINGKISFLDYNAEGAYQAGKYSLDTIDAFAAHAAIGLATPFPLNSHFSFEGNWGSGDDNPADRRRKRFDNLYPTNHSKYGYIDFFQWSNMHNLRAGWNGVLGNNIKLSLDYHYFELDTNQDAWRTAGGAAKRNASPGSRKKVGDEVDFLIKAKIRPGWGILGGYSHFFAGPYATATGTSDDADFAYLQTVLNF